MLRMLLMVLLVAAAMLLLLSEDNMSLCAVTSDLEDAVALVVEYMDGGSLQDLAEAGGCACEGVLANISAQVSE